jgi:hypothetical protein
VPELNKLYEEYAPRGVQFVGLTVEKPGADAARVREFAREFKMSYRLGYADPDVALALMAATAIPQTLVVAADGHIAFRIRGYSNKIPQILRDNIEKTLNPTAEPPTAAATPAQPATRP